MRIRAWSCGRAWNIYRILRTQLTSLVSLRMPITLSDAKCDGRQQLLETLTKLQGLEELHLDRVPSDYRLTELRVAGLGCAGFLVRSSTLLQLPQLQQLSLHNVAFQESTMLDITSSAPGLRELHISGWLLRQDNDGSPLFAPRLTRTLVRGAVRLQHLQWLQLTVCAGPSFAPQQWMNPSERTTQRRLRNAGLRIARHRENRML